MLQEELTQLHQDLQTLGSGGSITLDESVLGSERIPDIWSQTIALSSLQVSVISIRLEGESCVVEGNVQSLLGVSELRILATFFFLDSSASSRSALECLITASLPASWAFSDTFPDMPPSIDFSDPQLIDAELPLLDCLSLLDPEIVVSSVEGPLAVDTRQLADGEEEAGARVVEQGLNVLARVKPMSALGLLASFNPSNSGLFFYAHLDKATTPPGVRAVVGPLFEVDANFARLRLAEVRLLSAVSSDAPGASSESSLHGDLSIGDGDNELVLDFNATFASGLDWLWVTGEFEGAASLTLEDLARLAGGEDLGQYIPSALSSADSFGLMGFGFGLSPSTGAITSIEVRVGSTAPWPIAGEALSVRELDLGWVIQSPFDSERETTLQISGVLEIGGVDVEVRAYMPGLIVYGALAPGESIELSTLLAQLVPNADFLPALTVTELRISVDPIQRDWSLSATIAEDWRFDLPGAAFLLSYVSVDLRRQSGRVSGFLTAAFGIGDADSPIDGVIIQGQTQYGADGSVSWQLSGSTGPDQEIPIGRLIEDLTSLFGDVTLPAGIVGLTISAVAIAFNTKTKDFYFTCDSQFPLGGDPDETVDMTVDIDLSHQADGSFTHRFGGSVTLDGRVFDLQFSQQPDVRSIAATYHMDGGDQIDVNDLVDAVSPSVGSSIPAGLTITLFDALFAHQKEQAESKLLLGLDMGAGVDLSNLPLVGSALPTAQSVKLGYRLLAASDDFSPAEAQTLNEMLPDGVPALPDGGFGAFSLATTLQLGSDTIHLDLPVSPPDGSARTPDNQSKSDVNPDNASRDGVHWYSLQKSFGPAHFERIGAQIKSPDITFLLDASLDVGGLTISLDGLSVTSPLDHLDPTFGLDGIGVEYTSGPVEIGAAFLEIHPPPQFEFAGEALIKTEKLSLSAIGSYAKLADGHPSMLLYGVLEGTFGGPAFFFVTGLAAGFGYNRALTAPSVDDVAEFPFVAIATGDLDPKPTFPEILKELEKYVAPAAGENFLAAGIKFTSFKMVDSFVLLTVAFGETFELDVLGLSTLVAPTPEKDKDVDPLAVIQMAVKASFRPDEGFLGVEGTLTDASFILSKACKPTGGFAFYSWFSGDHAGDFVTSLGGYHPKFKVPAHYPTVPRLGFTWDLSDDDTTVTIKGGAYYALTAHALMAGGFLEADYQDGALKASFKVEADFLVAWQPYHYDGSVSVEIEGSYDAGITTISLGIGASVHIWGPPFAGTATLDLTVTSVDVDFGDHGATSAPPINWTQFKTAFLPDPDKVCGVSVQSGLVRTAGEGTEQRWIVNPKELEIVTNSVIPSKSADLGTAGEREAATTEFGVRSMNVGTELRTTHKVTINRVSSPSGPVESEFTFEPILKHVPTGLWGAPPARSSNVVWWRKLSGDNLKPGANDASFIEDALSGYLIKPANPPKPSQTREVERRNLLFNPETPSTRFQWADDLGFERDPIDDAERRTRIDQAMEDQVVAARRSQLLNALGVDASQVATGGFSSAEFLVTPAVERAATS